MARSRCTKSPRPRFGIHGSKLRLCTPAESGGSYGIKSGVYVPLVLMAVCSRALGVPVRWSEDRVEHMLA